MGRRTSQHGRFPFLFEENAKRLLSCACLLALLAVCVCGLGSGEAVGRGESGSHFTKLFF